MAVHSILRFVRSYTSETHAIPVGVVLWHDGVVPDRSYVGFKAIEPEERIRGLLDERDRRLAELAIEKIRHAIDTRTALHDREPSSPWTTRWWAQMENCLVHSLRLTPQRAIDLPASDEGLAQLYTMTMRPFRIPAVLPPGAYTDMHAVFRNGRFEHFYPSVAAVRMCDSKNPVHAVRVRQDDNGSHWGWWGAERQQFSMIWPSRLQVEVCFTYGSEAAMRIGDGLVCRLSIEDLGEV